MKRIITVGTLMIVSLSLISCGNKNEQEKTDQVELTTVDEKSEDSNIEEHLANDQTSILSTTDGEEWDQMLDDYEEYVNSYVRFYKKAMTGDMTAIQSYPEMLEKAESLQESIENAQKNNELSMKQITRMSEIQTNMLKGMQ